MKKKLNVITFITVSLVILLMFSFFITACKKEAKEVTLTLGSWRVDDVKQVEKLIEAFNSKYPSIKIKFDPTNPPEYNSVLRTQLEGGTAPDLFYTRSFTITRELYNEGFLESLEDLPGIKENFTDASLSPWATDDGVPYSVPFMAVSHGIYYNVDLFNELGIKNPETWEELISDAKTIKDAGKIPFANGSKDEWDMAEIVFMNLAPNFIGGREGRLEYESGKRPFNDENIVAAFQACKDLAPYLPKGQEAVSYYDAQQLFLQGQAAMFFGGSWDISTFENENPGFKWNIFATPSKSGQDTKYICFHMDAGVGLNKASKNKEAARKFLSWLTTKEAATVLGNEIPGFFPIIKESITLTNEHANTFLSLNNGRELDVRFVWPKLLGGNPSGYNLIMYGTIDVIKGKKSPKQAADELQEGLAKWYKP